MFTSCCQEPLVFQETHASSWAVSWLGMYLCFKKIVPPRVSPIVKFWPNTNTDV